MPQYMYTMLTLIIEVLSLVTYVQLFQMTDEKVKVMDYTALPYSY